MTWDARRKGSSMSTAKPEDRKVGAGGTPERIIQAALATLQREGYAKTTARAIAGTGGFNSALIFYYFGSLNRLLLAALDQADAVRLARHQVAFDQAHTADDFVRAALRIYREDLESGHIKIFGEMVGASIANPELRRELAARAEPWVELIERTLHRVLAGTPLDGLPARDLAYAAVTWYLGVNLFSYLDADRSRIQALFDLAARLPELVGPIAQLHMGPDQAQ
jgi:AcrR family transcriptional regulator